MTQVTLKYWQKGRDLIFRQQCGTIVERVYINAGRDSLGYWERREEVTDRGVDSYYDRHRHTKGDSVVTAGPEVRFVSDSLDESDVLDAIGVGQPEIDQANVDNGGGLFVAVSRKARGGHPSWYGTTPKAEARKMEKAREVAVYEI